MNSHSARKVVSLAEYRAKTAVQPEPTIKITLRADGQAAYTFEDLRDEDAFRGVLCCFAVMGKLLQKVHDNLQAEI